MSPEPLAIPMRRAKNTTAETKRRRTTTNAPTHPSDSANIISGTKEVNATMTDPPDPDAYLDRPDHSDDGDPADEDEDRREWLRSLREQAEREREWRQSR